MKVRLPALSKVDAIGRNKRQISFFLAFAMDCIPRTLLRGQTYKAPSS